MRHHHRFRQHLRHGRGAQHAVGTRRGRSHRGGAGGHRFGGHAARRTKLTAVAMFMGARDWAGPKSVNRLAAR